MVQSTCMVNPSSVTSSGCPAVLVDDPAEAIASLHRSSRQRDHVGRLTGPSGASYAAGRQAGLQAGTDPRKAARAGGDGANLAPDRWAGGLGGVPVRAGQPVE